MSDVTLTEVSKQYPKGGLAVDRFTLTIHDGEFLVLVGPSGCGKSTTLRMIAGLEEISSGELLIDGKRMNGIPPKDRDIAMVFQNYALYPHMSVYDNMAFGLKLRRLPKKEIAQRVEEAAEALGLTDYLKRLPKQLSGGQRQRVAVGRAIVRKPKVFLFDEPLSNLDAKMRVEMRTELRRLHRKLGATMIYVTHDQIEAMTMGDRIVVMNQGRIQQAAQPLEVYQKPANRFVAGFIGTPPMNMLRGIVHTEADHSHWIDLNGIRLDLHADLSAYHAQEITVGFRPETLRLTEDGEKPDLIGTVDVVEPMGAETDVHILIGKDSPIIARLSPNRIFHPGDPISLHLDHQHLSFFRLGGEEERIDC